MKYHQTTVDAYERFGTVNATALKGSRGRCDIRHFTLTESVKNATILQGNERVDCKEGKRGEGH